VAVTGLASALGIHQGTMTVDDAAARFRADAFLALGAPPLGTMGDALLA
jgi:hypothetical protein